MYIHQGVCEGRFEVGAGLVGQREAGVEAVHGCEVVLHTEFFGKADVEAINNFLVKHFAFI